MQVIYGSGLLAIDLEFTRVTKQGIPITLTKLEWGMLRALLSCAGRVVTTRQLLQEVWGPEFGSEGDYVRTYIKRLRKKLEPDPNSPRYILLERGSGYRTAIPDDVRRSNHPSILGPTPSQLVSLDLSGLKKARQEWREASGKQQRLLLMWANNVLSALGHLADPKMKTSSQPRLTS